MSEISVSEIPIQNAPFETLRVTKGSSSKSLNPTTQTDTNNIIYHIYSPPHFQYNPNELLRKYNLDLSKYYLNYQNSNRGTKTGRPNRCKNCKVPIEINNKMIRLTEKNEIEYDYGQDRGIRTVFKSWLFGSVECLISWLNENNPSDMI